jgi:hypothetical protein
VAGSNHSALNIFSHSIWRRNHWLLFLLVYLLVLTRNKGWAVNSNSCRMLLVLSHFMRLKQNLATGLWCLITAGRSISFVDFQLPLFLEQCTCAWAPLLTGPQSFGTSAEMGDGVWNPCLPKSVANTARQRPFGNLFYGMCCFCNVSGLPSNPILQQGYKSMPTYAPSSTMVMHSSMLFLLEHLSNNDNTSTS